MLWVIYIGPYNIFSFHQSDAKNIIVFRLGFTFQSSLMLIAFLTIMTFYKLFLYQKFNSFEKNKYNPIPRKFEVNVCFALKASSICYFFAITERTTLLRRLKKQLLWPRKQTSTQCFVRHWWMNASLGIVKFEIVSLFLKLIQKFIYIYIYITRILNMVFKVSIVSIST